MKINVSSILAQNSWWTINKRFAQKYGLNEAMLISELGWRQEMFSNNNMLDDDGFFYLESDKIKKATTINYHFQKKAHKKLIEIGVLEVKRTKSIPVKLAYKVNIEKLNEIVVALCSQ